MFVSPAPLAKSLDDPKATELSGRLNQLDKDLALAEQDILNRMRAPLDNSNPSSDLTSRLKKQEVRKPIKKRSTFEPTVRFFCQLHTLYD